MLGHVQLTCQVVMNDAHAVSTAFLINMYNTMVNLGLQEGVIMLEELSQKMRSSQPQRSTSMLQ